MPAHGGGKYPPPQPLDATRERARQAGGLTSVRGYLQSEAIGDDGILESTELRGPSFARFVGPEVADWRVFAFADLARVWIIGALPGQTDMFTLESIGAGMRIAALGHLLGVVDVALPLRSGPATPARRPRITFSVKSEL